MIGAPKLFSCANTAGTSSINRAKNPNTLFIFDSLSPSKVERREDHTLFGVGVRENHFAFRISR
jgi:hypothetical protein